MKHLLRFIAFFMTLALQAQTNTFTAAIDGNWNNANNWSLITLPGSTHDVVIPTGLTVTLNTSANIRSIQLAGTAGLTIQGNLSIAQASNASAQSVITWTGGNLSGGGTLNNLGLISVLPAGGKQILGGTTINNSGTIIQETDWHIDIVDGTINNATSGIIELKGTFSNIGGSGSGSHLLNNAGLIKKTGSNSAIITAELHNTGIIAVESGNMTFNNPQIQLNGGTYNTSAGAVMVWGSTETVSGNLTGNILGEMHWSGTVNVPVAANFAFTGNGLFNWGNGRLTGGGILTNNSLLQLTGAYFGSKYIENGTTLVNAGTIKITTDWSLDITDGTLNNLASGIIDLNISQVQILGTGTGSHIINNAGTIKKTLGTGMGSIRAQVNNTGTIAVESGMFEFRNPATTLTGGVYNVSAGCYLFNAEPVICSGVLTGLVEGGINWTSDINVPVAATFNFSGNGMINWAAGSIKGGGTLTNLGILELSSGWVGNKFIAENTTLVNTNMIKITSGQAITMNGGTIVNPPAAIIDIQSPGDLLAGTGVNIINNQGTIVKSMSTGTYTINATTSNYGVINANAGILAFGSLNNTVVGKIQGSGAIAVPASTNFSNEGIFAPGGEPGQLYVPYGYVSTANTRLMVQLYGLTQSTQYDLLSIGGNAVMAGTVVPELYFDAAIGDSFTVAITSGTITSCNLNSTATAAYNGQLYTFNVGCQNDNKVILTLASKTVLANENFNAFDQQIVLTPNPAQDIIHLKNDSNLALNEAMIIDMSGRTIQTINLKGVQGDQEIRLNGLASGQYLMKINSDQNSAIKRFVVK